MVLNQDDFVNDILDDVCIPLRMDNLDIQEFYQLGYGLDDVPNNLPIESNRIFFFVLLRLKTRFFLTLTFDI